MYAGLRVAANELSSRRRPAREAMRQATTVFPAMHPPMTGGSLKADGHSIVMMRECAPHTIATLHVVPQSTGK